MKKLKNWLDQEHRYARQIEIARNESPLSREMVVIQERIWRKLLLHFRKAGWISGIAADGR